MLTGMRRKVWLLITSNGGCSNAQVNGFPAFYFPTNSARLLGCALALACCIGEAKAKGGSYQMDEVYNPQHISSLPPEIRASVYAVCNEPRALHTFAEYRDIVSSRCTSNVCCAAFQSFRVRLQAACTRCSR